MEEEKVTIGASELRELLDSNRKLMQKVDALSSETAEEMPTLLRKEVEEKTVRVAFIDGKPVIGYKNRGTETRPQYAYERPDPENPKEMILYIDVLLDGVDEAQPIRYKELMNEAEHTPCKVLKTESKPWEVLQGTVEAMQLPEGDKYRMESKGYKTPVGATGVTRTYTVQLPDGKELKISDQYVNIA